MDLFFMLFLRMRRFFTNCASILLDFRIYFGILKIFVVVCSINGVEKVYIKLHWEINKIDFQNNEIFSDFKLRTQFKKTKQKIDFRLWKASKFIEEEYTNDLKLLIDFYKENGYRDARIVNDSLIQNGNNKLLRV